MIAVCFCLVISLFLGAAWLAGDVGAVINVDSLIIVLASSIISLLAVSNGQCRALLRVLGGIFCFTPPPPAMRGTVARLGAAAVMTLGAGLCSTAQGLCTMVFNPSTIPWKYGVLYASYTSLYSLMLVIFLFVPLMVRNVLGKP